MTFTPAFHLEDTSIHLSVRALHGVERLGAPPRYELEFFSPEPVEVSAVLGKACGLRLSSGLGERWISGVVTRFVRIATAQSASGRRYRAVVEPSWSLLRLSRRARVLQHMAAPDLIKTVLVNAGFPADRIDVRLGDSYAERDYVVQWMEDDLTFIRRLCEEESLYFRADTAEDGETFVLEDTSSAATPFEATLSVTDASGLARPELAAWSPRLLTERRAGKVTLRDHNPARPAANLESSALAGAGIEADTEVFAAPGRFRSPSEGDARAKRLLESLRADAKRLVFETSAIGLTPGRTVTLEHAGDYAGGPSVEGEYFVTSVEVRFNAGSDTGGVVAAVIPKDTPYRLPRRTPRPRIDGVQAAIVTGPPGQEIHVDDAGRVNVRFFWDRSGPADHTSSLPVRVMQPNTPGSMVIPRVGWEVAVAFEDGDPDRPYVLGRVYNAATPPPVALPANKTMTVLRSFSSPGGGANNTISFDDAAGRQHVMINAGFGKSTSVGDAMMIQTARVEEQSIGAIQTASVGAKDALTVKESSIAEVGSQTSTVGASQNIYVKGNLNVSVGSESVLIGGALLEKVGNPVTGALNLGVNAALSGAGVLGQRLGPVGQAMTSVGTMAAGVGWGMFQAANAPGAGPHAARDAGLQGLLGVAASFVPGGGALVSSLSGSGRAYPWEAPPQGSGSAQKGGGAGGGASDSAGAQGPGPGHRGEIVKGPYAEVIGGAHVVTTPGNVAWQTTGSSSLLVGGGHSTKALSVGARVLGASNEMLGSLHVNAKSNLSREVKGAITTTVGGGLKVKASGGCSMAAGSKMVVQAGGSMTCEGGVVVFVVGSSIVAASSGGVLVKAGTIKINGATKQSGDTTH
jgi:type VI secretion system secreted protein VgrG